jgi:hypothetical protein
MRFDWTLLRAQRKLSSTLSNIWTSSKLMTSRVDENWLNILVNCQRKLLSTVSKIWTSSKLKRDGDQTWARVACNSYQLSSTLIKWHQLLSTDINRHQLLSTDINSYQLSSTLINGHQLLSTVINRHNSYQLTSTLINWHQLSSTLINSYQLSSTLILVWPEGWLLFMLLPHLFVADCNFNPLQKETNSKSKLFLQKSNPGHRN